MSANAPTNSAQHTDLAVDLKRQIETLLVQGRSDKEIRDYMVARYGDFVLYRPPVQSNTWFLWFGPFLMLLGGGLLWWLVQRRSRASAVSQSAPELAQAPRDEERLSRARDLLRPRD